MGGRRVAQMAAALLLAFAAEPAAPHDAPPLGEFLPSAWFDVGGLSADQAATLKAIRGDPAAIDIRIGPANPDAVRDALAVSFMLPAPYGPASGTAVSFHSLELEQRAEQDYSLYFRDDPAGSEVALIVLGPDVLGTIRYDGVLYKVHPLGEGLTALYRYDTSRLPPHAAGGEQVPAEHRQVPPAHLVAGATPLSVSPVIDILVPYTRRARIQSGNVEALLRHAFDETNRIYANSQIRPRVRLVHSYQAQYVQGDSLSTDLHRLQAPADGHMDDVHVRRDEHAADVVVLLVGHGDLGCSSYYRYLDDARYAFAVIARSCFGVYRFAQLLGFIQGASANPEFFPNHNFPYGHGFCNDPDNWRTVMAWNSDHRCPVHIPYFSNPDVPYAGVPTGDVETHDNARVINETAERVAGFRLPPPRPRSFVIPLFMAADHPSQVGFVRIINRSNRSGTVRILAVDDEGGRSAPVALSLGANASAHFNSMDLEQGNPDKGLSTGAGDGSGNWRLELDTDLDIEPRAYIRTSDGFLTSIHEVAANAGGGSVRYHVPIFNPGSNQEQQSRLRLINLGEDAAHIVISALDDRGEEPPQGEVTLTLLGGAARVLAAQELEEGGDGFSGRFGDGAGKWQLWVSANRPVAVMSLLQSPTGNLTNLSP